MEDKVIQIQVLGSGCSTCKKLFEFTNKAVKELNLKVKVEYITDVQKIVDMGIISSPVLAINGKPVMTGILPNLNKLKDIIKKSI
jgi:small redox-active disulfide protein 2